MALDLKTDTAPAAPVVMRTAPGAAQVLTPEALVFVGQLQQKFAMRLNALLVGRARRQDRLDGGELPGFAEDTTTIRQGIWQASSLPAPLQDRRIEIVGGCKKSDLSRALQSGAKSVIVDFEDTASPSFSNMIDGQTYLMGLRDGPTIIMRPRGIHLSEGNVLLNGSAINAALFDFGLHIFHNGRALAEAGQGPFYYLPKLDNAEEARFWNDVFAFAQEAMGIEAGTVKATVMIETIQAVFEMDEIIWELRDHIAGLCCGHDDLTFSYLTALRAHPAYTLPDTDQVTPDGGFLASAAARLVKVCHRRGILAIGGMNACTPDAGQDQLGRDMARIIGDGHDGAWVAHPDQVAPALAIWDRDMPEPNQIRRPRQQYRIEPDMLLRPHQGDVTEAGAMADLSLAIEYMAQWLQGNGNAEIGPRVVDLAAAEIARCQLRQWIRHAVPVHGPDGPTRLTNDRLGQMVQQRIVTLLDELGPGGFHRGHYASAARIVQTAITTDTDYLTTPALAVLNALD